MTVGEEPVLFRLCDHMGWTEQAAASGPEVCLQFLLSSRLYARGQPVLDVVEQLGVLPPPIGDQMGQYCSDKPVGGHLVAQGHCVDWVHFGDHFEEVAAWT